MLSPEEMEEEHREAAHAGILDLQRSGGGKRKRCDEDKNKKPPSRSKKDQRNESTRTILECSDRMRDMAALLRECVKQLEDDNEDVRKSAVGTLQSSIIPFLENGSKVIRKAAVYTSSMASIDVAHDRISRREKKALVSANIKKNPNLQLIEHSTEKFAARLKKSEKTPPNPPPPPASVPKKQPSPPPPPEFELDEPMNGSQYTKIETVVQLRKTPTKSKMRKKMMDEMVQLGYVPVKIRSLQRLMEQDAKGIRIKNAPWVNGGRPPLLSDDDIDEFVEKLGSPDTGMTFNKETVKSLLISKKEAQLSGKGLAVGAEPEISESAVRNYMAIIGCYLNLGG